MSTFTSSCDFTLTCDHYRSSLWDSGLVALVFETILGTLCGTLPGFQTHKAGMSHREYLYITDVVPYPAFKNTTCSQHTSIKKPQHSTTVRIFDAATLHQGLTHAAIVFIMALLFVLLLFIIYTNTP